jgi:hypothetical protein
MPRRPARARGVSLLEVMIALGVLTVGLLAMWHLHMIGVGSTSAARRHTIATALARELASGLERLPFADLRLADTATGAELPEDGVFGRLVTGEGALVGGAHHVWDDDQAIAGVRLDADMREQGDAVVPTAPCPSRPYDRRWSVWGYVSPRAPAGSPSGVKLVAVSVTWCDPPFTRPREVLLYTQVTNPAALAAGLGMAP